MNQNISRVCIFILNYQLLHDFGAVYYIVGADNVVVCYIIVAYKKLVRYTFIRNFDYKEHIFMVPMSSI